MSDDVTPECLRDIVQKIIDARKSEERVSPAWVATEAPAERKRRTQKSYGALRTIRITWRSY
jgi:hypothetical protein